MPVKSQLQLLLEQRASLTRAQARALMEQILAGQASELEIAAVLGAIAARGETPEELAGLVDAMRLAGLPTPVTEQERSLLVDTCGTGGDGADTFNISTAAALVATAAGAKVAKHGNRAVTSKSGSADVLEALGIPVDLSPEGGAEAIRQHGFAYLHAPAMNPAMKVVMPVRRALGVRTIFNLAGPLTNPARAQAQVMGVYAADRVSIVAEAMLLLGTHHAFVVHGFVDDDRSAGMDELSISGHSLVAEVRDRAVIESIVMPEDVGLERAPIAMLRGGDALENAAILRAVFAGKPGPCRDVVVLNASAVLVAAGLSGDLKSGVALAQQTIDSGSVLRLLARIAS